MRTARFALAALLLALVAVPYALAESQTVQGAGDIQKMSAKNGERAVTVKVFGIAKPCDAHFLNVEIFWGKKKAYRAEAGCYGVDWMTNLYYYENRNAGQGGDEVRCGKFEMAYNKDRGFYRVFIPRKCLGFAPNKIRVRAEGRNYAGSPLPGEAGPTKALARG